MSCGQGTSRLPCSGLQHSPRRQQHPHHQQPQHPCHQLQQQHQVQLTQQQGRWDARQQPQQQGQHQRVAVNSCLLQTH